MEHRQEISYQLDLFSEQKQNDIRSSDHRKDVNQAKARKAKQVNKEGEQGRAIPGNLITIICSSSNLKQAYKQVKQTKRVIGLVRFLKKQGIETWQAWIIALSGKGWWRKSATPQIHQAMNNSWFAEQNLFNLSLNYAEFNY